MDDFQMRKWKRRKKREVDGLVCVEEDVYICEKAIPEPQIDKEEFINKYNTYQLLIRKDTAYDVVSCVVTVYLVGALNDRQ